MFLKEVGRGQNLLAFFAEKTDVLRLGCGVQLPAPLPAQTSSAALPAARRDTPFSRELR